MASNSVEFRVVVNADGLVTGLKQVTAFGNETQKAGKKAREAGDAADHLNYRMNQGVTGASSAARSFSKLNQTIGQGNGGLVGAYATLAANAFAVSASFNALREAAQVEQLMQGLEIQGAKTGRTLTTVAKNIQEITDGSISASEAMRAAAQGSTSGISGKDLEDLTKVATNASKVLGRNVPDSLDRIIKGVTKLEPELLDELGLMTKLTEASEAYARQQGKSAASLTNFEKRAAFTQAILTEGTQKYAGVENAVDTNQFDRLAASFQNLVQSVLGFVATSDTLRFILDNLNNGFAGLIAVSALFVSSIKGQLLGSIVNLSKVAEAAAKASNDKAKDLSKSAELALKSSKDLKESAKNNLEAATSLSTRLPGIAKENLPKIIDSSATEEEVNKTIKSLEASSKRYSKTLKDLDTDFSDSAKAAKTRARDFIAANTLIIESINQTEAARQKVQQSEKENAKLAREANLAELKASKETAIAGSIDAASKGKVKDAFVKNIEASKAYKAELGAMRAAQVASAEAAGLAAPRFLAVKAALDGVRVAALFTTTALKGMAIALVAALNWIGIIAAAISVLQYVYDKFFVTDADRAKTKAYEDFGRVVDSTKGKLEEYARVVASDQQVGDRVIQANIIKANTLVELADAYIKAGEAANLAAKNELEYSNISRGLSNGKRISDMSIEEKLALEQRQKRLRLQKTLAEEAGVPIQSQAANFVSGLSGAKSTFGFIPMMQDFSDEALQMAQSLNILNEQSPKLYKDFVNNTKAGESFVVTNTRLTEVMKLVTRDMNPVGKAFENLQSQLKATDQVQTDFSRSIRASTQYDEPLKSIEQLNTAFNQVIYTLEKSPEKAKAVEQFQEALTAIGPSVLNIMSVDTQRIKASFDQVSDSISALKAKRKELEEAPGNNRGQIAIVDSQIVEQVGIQVELRKKLASSIPNELKAYSDILRDNQLITISSQAQVTLAQARLSALQRQGIVTGEDVKKQIALQNSIVAAQVKQEKANLALIEAEGRKLEARELQIKQEERLLDLMKSQTIQQERQGLLAKVTQAKSGTAEKVSAISDLAAFDAMVRSGATPEELRKQKELEKAELRRQREVNAAQTAAQRAKVQAAGLGATTKAEERAAVSLQKLNNLKTTTQLQNESKNLALETQDIEARIADSKVGGLNTLKLELDAIKRNNEEKLKQLKVDQQFRVREIEINLEKARSLNNTSQVKFYTDLLNATKERNTAETKNTEAKNQQAILDKIGLNTEEERLNLLRESLSIQERIQSVIVDNIRSQADLANITRRLELRRLGVSDETISRGEEIANAETALKIAQQEKDMKVALIKLEFALLEAKRQQSLTELKNRLEGIDDERKRSGDPLALSGQRSTILASIENLGGTLVNGELKFGESIVKYAGDAAAVIENGVKIAAKNLENVKFKRRASGPGDIMGETRGITENILKEFGKESTEALPIAGKLALTADIVSANMSRIRDSLMELGPEGAIVVAIGDGIANLSGAFSELGKATNNKEMLAAGLNAASAVLSTISSITKASSDARIASIDREIAAEQKRDGKSAESISKLQALEKKKDDIARKSFNTQKKLMLAQAVMSTAAAIASVLASPMLDPVSKTIFAGIIGAMGAAQIAVIAGTQYNSGAKSTAAATPSTLSIGKRSDTVDLARGPSANAGGEVGFLRGSQGMGTNASNFRTIGSAYGGELMRGYGNRGFVVGEKGPEVITPETPINVTPANDVMGSAPVNATINIQALDASGIESILVSQKGNIIKMLRQAANASGQGFLEDVNTNIYTRPNVNRL